MHARRNWKMRFFILEGADLTYYEDRHSHKAKGSVRLRKGCKIQTQQAVVAGKGRVPVRWPGHSTKQVPSFFSIEWDGSSKNGNLKFKTLQLGGFIVIERLMFPYGTLHVHSQGLRMIVIARCG